VCMRCLALRTGDMAVESRGVMMKIRDESRTGVDDEGGNLRRHNQDGEGKVSEVWYGMA
jgi:hypothetical protein